MGTTPTVLPAITPTGFVARLLALFPNPWTGDTAKAPGGNLYSLFQAFANQITYILGGLQYAQNASRIATATNGALDLVSQDLFGAALPRLPGENDTSFRARIKAALFPDAATRPAITAALTTLIGVVPRVIEPWSPGDTGVIGPGPGAMYFDVDTPVTPGRITDSGLRYQGFIEAPLPVSTELGGNPVPTLDDSFWIDVPGQALFEPDASWFQGETAVYALLNKIKAFGTVIWTKLIGATPVAAPQAGIASVTTGATSVFVPLTSFLGFYMVAVLPNWDTEVWHSGKSSAGFTLNFSVAAPSGALCDWRATPYDGVNFFREIIAAGLSAFTLAAIGLTVPFFGANAAEQINSTGSGGYAINPAAPALAPGVPALELDVSYLTDTVAAVTLSAMSVTLSFPEPTATYRIFAVPNWATLVWYSGKTTSGITLNFSVAAPASASVAYAIE